MIRSFLFVAAFCFQFVYAVSTPTRYTVNLTNTEANQLTVLVTPASTLKGEVFFRMPKIIPGTYSIYDFGRFVTDFTFETKSGKTASLQKVDDNTWKITGIENVLSLQYKVHDTWNAEDKSNWVFEPAGTNFEAGKNYVLNNHGVFGYFEGTTSDPVEVEVTRPTTFYGSTALNYTSEKNKDMYRIPNYHTLVDSPIMYCEPDTTILNIGNSKVLISVYNANKQVTSEYIANQIAPILDAIKIYLGGELPVDKYAFLLYLPSSFMSFGFGALEHNNSSFYFLPAFGGDYLGQMVKDVSAHEFFHIVTPLTFHSEEIHYFDYNNPKMSKHLWLYEGVTEYSAHLVQVRQGLISLDDFLTEMNDKINSAKNFNDTLPFTLLSQACLTTYKTQYLNVYQKGALIGMCLDLTLLHLSNGEMDLPKLLNKLSKEYGANKPFKDDELFEIMAKNSYPAVLDFLNNYVGGSKPLPFEQVFSYAGVEFSKGGMVDITDFGFDFEQAGYDEKTDKFYIISDADISPVGKAMGLKAGDIIQKIKDKELKMETVYEILLDLYQNTKPADPLSYEVARPLKNNKTKKIVLKGRVGTKAMSVEGGLSLIENPTDSQRKIMKAWTNQ